ncbi:MAG: precorrin-2 C(20)-methyltransferase [Mediterranea sp.]|jgi:precorrin-2/cobalt-factor-2 C20-methyltransferase|nr:precorrin-2 C(20)-methyltransferase [Mediterranea sp.]
MMNRMETDVKSRPVMFVSLGPAEMELITLKGYRHLMQADVILCPATMTGNGKASSRAADILRGLDAWSDKIELFPVPMSKDRSAALPVYDRMCEAATAYHRAKRRVAVVAEGDAGFYSSIHYVYEKLHDAGIPVLCIPGVPAFIACGAVAGLHIVRQDERLMVIPGNTTADELAGLLEAGVTVVVMKPSLCADELRRFIVGHPDHHYHYFENVGTEAEYYTHCRDELPDRAFPYFSLMIIRKTR